MSAEPVIRNYPSHTHLLSSEGVQEEISVRKGSTAHGATLGVREHPGALPLPVDKKVLGR